MKFDKAALTDSVLAHFRDIDVERSGEAGTLCSTLDKTNRLLLEVSDADAVVTFHIAHEHFYDFAYKSAEEMAVAVALFKRM